MNFTVNGPIPDTQSAFIFPEPKAFEDWNISCQKAAILYGQQVSGGGTGTPGGPAIPSGQTSAAVTYYPGTNNIQTVTYQPSGSVMTITYVGGGASDDDLISGWSVS